MFSLALECASLRVLVLGPLPESAFSQLASKSEGDPLTCALLPVFDYEGFRAYSELPQALAQRRLGLGRLDASGRPRGRL